MSRLLQLLAIVLATAASLPAVQGANATLIHACNEERNRHCFYTPRGEYLAHPNSIDLTDDDKLLWLETDETGATTYLFDEGSHGSFAVSCLNGGGRNGFYFSLNRRYSVITHAALSSGKATVAFNDAMSTQVKSRRVIAADLSA
ncbi:hypothetical protein BDZ90DRAFT_233221 [Jaminaea rosea]|uniref:Uncharacterized protein n=1 Tax=Jaminaea rosea TaxID=1569628 RepID=A0A316UMT6_9BASI|nr:hypothetical protein BDZ90DRAFT_233221 [Jaminaea rosea]PWN26612.1 hypothetical protein BDZ90DRAFT_233221 [Jaminaea rosea]